MIETILAMVYVGGAIGCGLAVWNHPAANLRQLREEQRALAVALALVISWFWPTVLAACLVRGALDE